MTCKPDPSIIRRLAVACSRGHKQTSMINELLAGPVYATHRHIGHNEFLEWGDTCLGGSSFLALRKRLIAVGFVFSRAPGYYGVITMTFPEGTK